MSAKLVCGGHVTAAPNFLPPIPKTRPRLDRPPVGHFPTRFPLPPALNGHFNPGARWLEFPLDGPWRKRPRPVRLDRDRQQ